MNSERRIKEIGKLNSFDDWSPLEEIIVGSAENYLSHDRELSFDVFFHENIYCSHWAYPRLNTANKQKGVHSISKQYVTELHEDVEQFATKLKELGIRVKRPLTLPKNTSVISGLGWNALPVPALNIRDNTLIVGNEIIETPPAIRSRYLETRLLAPVFRDYFNNGARWTTMPRPILNDSSFDLSYAKDIETTLGGPTESISEPKPSPFDIGFEMMLDGAQCLRIGKDIIVNIANQNHAMACDWLERHLSNSHRLHRVCRMSDNHIDSMILALRPGVFLARHEGIKSMMPKDFQKWQFLVPPEPSKGDFPTYNDEDLVLTSPYIDLNVLSLDEKRVIVNENCKGLIKLLDKQGFDPIPIRHRHRRLFGGGFHCFTLDTVRKGGLNDYR